VRHGLAIAERLGHAFKRHGHSHGIDHRRGANAISEVDGRSVKVAFGRCGSSGWSAWWYGQMRE
jgi:hypothetical protein